MRIMGVDYGDARTGIAISDLLCSIVGIALNVLLFAGKYLAGVLSGSIAITADAFNNLSDAGSSVVTLIGFKLASLPPDPEHPFGHERIEYLTGIFISIFIIIIGVMLGRSSIDGIINNLGIDANTLNKQNKRIFVMEDQLIVNKKETN